MNSDRYFQAVSKFSGVPLRFPPLGPVLLDPGFGCRCPIHIVQPTNNTTKKTRDSLDHWSIGLIVDNLTSWQVSTIWQEHHLYVNICLIIYNIYTIKLYIPPYHTIRKWYVYDSRSFWDWNIQVQWPGDLQNLPTLTSIFKPRARFNATLNSSKGVTSSKSVSKTCKTHQSWCSDCWDSWDLWLCRFATPTPIDVYMSMS